MVTPVDDKQARLLFAEQRISDYLASRMHSYKEDLARWDPDELLARTPEDIAAELHKRHGVTSLRLLDPDSPTDSVDRTVNLGRAYSPFDVRRTVRVFRLSVPFTGDAGLFSVQPTTHTLNPPAGHVDASRRRLTVEFAHPAGDAVNTEKVTQAFQETLDKVSWYLDELCKGVDHHNAQIADLGPIQQRIAAVRADREVLSRIRLPKVGDTQG